MDIRKFAIGVGLVAITVGFYIVNYYGGFRPDLVWNTALDEADGDSGAALLRLGAAYVDQQGQLRRLTLSRSIARQGKSVGLPDYQLSNAVLETVGQVKTLEALEIGQKTWIDDSGMTYLSELPNLHALTLKFTPLKAQGLQSLAHIDSLRLLIVAGAQLTDADIAAAQRTNPNLTIVRWPMEAGHMDSAFQDAQQAFIDDVTSGRLQRVATASPAR